jgi:murein DD-endopeptidase MepM/ murein hydrolase activator NlpD
MKNLSLLLILVSLVFGLDISIKKSSVANGRCFLLKSNEDGSKYVAFEGKRYYFFPTKNDFEHKFYALVPVNYYSKPHSSKIVAVAIKDGEKEYKIFKVKVIDGHYKSEKLTVAPNKAKFNKKTKVRIKKEAKEALKIYNTITPMAYWVESFGYPMKSKITSEFGNKRVFNGILKSYHSGTDFRAKTGTPIYSVNRGRVVLVKNRYLSGNSVILDHGEGIYTCYYHMSRFKVKRGQLVEKGELLGFAGATGRVTGPHLHFSTRVDGVQVDPLQLLRLLNEI